ncbi:hypothetical protein uav_168 [Pseudomonas phage UAVern]|uniref:Uncharacterized protein n=1 Tax=Pseudomonas phage UAVern TaxID=2856997 RepID=A0A975UUK1_9CAUD|nr:hypothetical protein uav_168 [Pseudomonas phage UAVern]
MAIPENNCVDIDTPCYPSPDMGRFGQVINLYVQDPVCTPEERAAFSALVLQLPPPMQHGVRTRVWRFFYPDAPYPGLTVGMRDVTVTASNEVLVPYDTFDMNSVPWDKLGGIC